MVTSLGVGHADESTLRSQYVGIQEIKKYLSMCVNQLCDFVLLTSSVVLASWNTFGVVLFVEFHEDTIKSFMWDTWSGYCIK